MTMIIKTGISGDVQMNNFMNASQSNLSAEAFNDIGGLSISVALTSWKIPEAVLAEGTEEDVAEYIMSKLAVLEAYCDIEVQTGPEND